MASDLVEDAAVLWEETGNYPVAVAVLGPAPGQNHSVRPKTQGGYKGPSAEGAIR